MEKNKPMILERRTVSLDRVEVVFKPYKISSKLVVVTIKYEKKQI